MCATLSGNFFMETHDNKLELTAEKFVIFDKIVFLPTFTPKGTSGLSLDVMYVYQS